MIGSIEVVDFRTTVAGARSWARDRRAFATTPGLRHGWLYAMQGSRRSRGFLPGIPAPRSMVAVAAWEDEASLARFAASDLASSWREQSNDWWRISLSPKRSSGSMYGVDPFASDGGPAEDPDRIDGPIAILTFAHVRWRWLPRFIWNQRRIMHSLTSSPGLITAEAFGNVGMGGGVTVSVWESMASVRGFAYAPHRPAHLSVIKRSRDESWMTESYFARLSAVSLEGTLRAARVPDGDRIRTLATTLAD